MEPKSSLRAVDYRLVWGIFMSVIAAVWSSAGSLYKLASVEEMVKVHEGELRIPRYTSADDDARMDQLRRETVSYNSQLQRELDKRERWVEQMNQYVLEATKTRTKLVVDLDTMGRDLTEIKKALVK